MRRVIGCLLVVAALLLTACGSSENGPVTLQPAAERHPGLTTSVTPFDTRPVVVNGIRVRLIGAEFGAPEKVGQGRAPDAKTSDDRGMLDAFAYGFGQGLAEGLSSPEDRKKRDAELALYFEMTVASEGNSPRDAKVADVPIEIRDDQDAPGLEVYRTYGFGLMKPGETYVEMLKVAVYSDSKRFFVRVGDDDGGVTWAFDAPPFIK